MKTLKELRSKCDLNTTEQTSFVTFLKRQIIDWDVYLPSLGINLQRKNVWVLDQKRELIMSVLLERHIPKCAILMSTVDSNNTHETYQIIDGKQRISAIFDYIDNKFTLELEGKEYLFSELPEDYQISITKYPIRYHVMHEYPGNVMSDQTKIDWFKFINYAGTPQEQEHINNLSKTIA